ncbi:MAG TPA: COX15/CtaA family protein [Polyangia bacterium]|nr:COX15/CtaA family protein [Polyangia bacterium]
MSPAAFRRFSLLTLIFVLVVILWGAYVRASGSGAGCGSHWPLCNGQVVPRAPAAATVIEFTHRLTSGLALVLILGQLVLAFRIFPRRHPVRRAAVASAAFILSEALIGAGLVLFEKVAGDKSVARAAWTASHLTNTFALVASVVLTGWFATHRQRDREPPRALYLGLLAGLGGALFVGVSGAIAALGDTLFPVRSFAEGWSQDLSPTAHLFVRLRVLHPLLAVTVGTGLLVVTGTLVLRAQSRGVRATATVAAALVLAQLLAGLVNLALLAPIPTQVLHLLLADLLWIALVRLAATLRWGV